MLSTTIYMQPRLFFLMFTLLMGSFLGAQSVNQNVVPPTDADVRKATEALVTKYSLNADQAKQMYQIQQRKNRNIADIAPFQTSDMALYQTKYLNVQNGTLASIRRILNTKEQVVLYQKTQSDIRRLRNAKRKEMTAQKASKEAIDSAVLAIYAE